MITIFIINFNHRRCRIENQFGNLTITFALALQERELITIIDIYCLNKHSAVIYNTHIKWIHIQISNLVLY